jgi:hypothetical protein
VKVIGQKHVGVNLHFVTTKRFLQQRKKPQAILLVGENALPPISEIGSQKSDFRGKGKEGSEPSPLLNFAITSESG